ncbi:MAG: tRNA (adenosine(37)-N6)-threonylcarbamoyltransferase complex dimerization subunit type 1 TsaB [Myxococcales bacterium]|nr:tRNA (adenosine(37)-N6)-threonylcarbamoyltransferase complex dimerization subunit type 1 TsaB [Myxococcales bacterium]
MALVEREGPALRVLEAVALGPPRRQSEMLPGEIGALLERHGLRLGQLEAIAVGLGPGSFTGLRIGLAAAKALAYSEGLRMAGVSSLAAVALEGPEGIPLAASAVARKGELYVGLYRREGTSVEALSLEQALSLPEAAALLASRPEALALGPSIREYRGELERLGVSPSRLLDEPSFPRAVAIAQLAQLPTAFDKQSLFALEPHYVRPSEAERNPRFPPLPGPAPAARIREEEG